MAVSVGCKKCAAKFAVKDHWAGKMIRCPQCQEDIVVPQSRSSGPPKPATRKSGAAKSKNAKSNGAAEPAGPLSAYSTGKKLQTAALLIGGVAMMVAGRFVYKFGFDAAANSQGPGYFILAIGLLQVILGSVLFVYGCVVFANGRGYSGRLGLLGILPIFGFFILWAVIAVADKRKASAPS